MVRFGVAGYPPAFQKSVNRRDRTKILEWVSGLGLDALELQMTYGPRMAIESCREYHKISKDLGLSISVHASYFIVFTSWEERKLERSNDTLKRTLDLCRVLGAEAVVLHPGPLYGENSSVVLDRFIENLGNCINKIGPLGIGLFVETAGKVGQLGSVDEILQICNELPAVFPCIDFGHVHARTLGALESVEGINELFDRLEGYKKQRGSHRFHFHYTPIHYGSKGEISHKAIKDTYPPEMQLTLASMREDRLRSRDGFFHPRVEPIARALRRFAEDCMVISETHNSQEEGALALKYAFHGSHP